METSAETPSTVVLKMVVEAAEALRLLDWEKGLSTMLPIHEKRAKAIELPANAIKAERVQLVSHAKTSSGVDRRDCTDHFERVARPEIDSTGGVFIREQQSGESRQARLLRLGLRS